jgi:hypothetical protein
VNVCRSLRIVLIASAVLTGCVSSQDAGKPFPASARHKLVVARTTQRDVRRLLGPPVTTAAVGVEGQERWTYEHTRVSARRSFPWIRGVSVEQTPYEQLILTFRSQVLSDCVYVVERYRTEAGLIVPAGSMREPCGVTPPKN